MDSKYHYAAPGTTSPNALATASYAFGGDPVVLGSKVAMSANEIRYS